MRIDKAGGSTLRKPGNSEKVEMKRIALIGFLAIVILISGCVKPETQQIKIPDNLTEEQKLIVKIALTNSTVKEMLKGKEVKIDSVSMVSGSTTENGKEISFNLPGAQIYIGNENWTSVIEIIPLVDLKEKRVVRILKGPFIKSILPAPLSEDDNNKAIKIALADSQVKEKIAGRVYEIVNVMDFENRFTEKRVGTTQVLIHVNGTGRAYSVTLNLTENKVIEVGEQEWIES
jgi:hypothetical protein